MGKKIPLSRGLFAIVDDDDYERLSNHIWHVSEQSNYEHLHPKRNAGPEEGDEPSTITMTHEIMQVGEKECVVHLNKNTLDCRKSNLRVVGSSLKGARRRVNANSSSQYKGVSLRKSGKWRAVIGVKGKKYNLGTFEAEEDAALAYDEAAREHFGELALTNFTRYGEPNPLTLGSTKKEEGESGSTYNVPRRINPERKATHRSSFRGVSWYASIEKWQARVTFKGKTYYLGAYEAEEEAAQAYDKGARKHFGKRALLNFPAEDEAAAA